MKRSVLLMLIAAAAVGEEYAGKYKDDPRLAAVSATLPQRLAEARKTIAVQGPVRIELRDLGKSRSGVAAKTARDADGFIIVLYTEPLVLRTHDVDRTLLHELVHCLQQERWGARGEVATPLWVKEGMAVHLAGQLASRERVLAAHVGREPAPADAAARLVNGLDGRHTLLDYFEDGAAFAGAEARHGKEKTQRFIDNLLTGMAAREAALRAFSERWETFEQESRKYARQRLDPLVRDGRKALLALRERVEAKEFEAALALPVAGGVYGPDEAYYRACALRGAGRAEAALDLLRKRILDLSPRGTTLLAPAVELEVALLAELGRKQEHAAALQASILDLEPYCE